MGTFQYLPGRGWLPAASRFDSLLRDTEMSCTCQSKHRNTSKTTYQERTLKAKPDEQEQAEGKDGGNELQQFDPMRIFTDSSITTRSSATD